MLNKLTSDQLKIILVAMASVQIKGSDAIEFAKIMELIGKSYEAKLKKENGNAADSV